MTFGKLRMDLTRSSMKSRTRLMSARCVSQQPPIALAPGRASRAGGSCSFAGGFSFGAVRLKRRYISWLDAYAYKTQMMLFWRNVQLTAPI